MNKKKRGTVYLVQAALIAAVYAAVTYIAAPLSFGAQQVRISEALTVLPVLTPAAVPGLTVGCIIANIGSPYGIADIICGGLATLIAALLTRAAGNIRFKSLPLLSPVFPVILNGLIIGLEITVFLPGEASFKGFILSFVSIALGEALSCYLLGLPLFKALDKAEIFK